MLMYFQIILFLTGMYMFVMNRKHLLLMLLSLEYLVVVLFLNLFFYLSMLENDYFFSMIFLTMSVCESVLGLSVLIIMVRVHGNDYIMTFSNLW
uniref:NADH-ubiquinone oxidoreductase chain 4L n=2 Tax=Altica TaxID=131581 RepID=A0A4P8JCS3_9CUCU|nr:NADH dehydrogenase subunit 4L [Altica cirsicola]YP_009826212.1 NADH dehydrogenase subunit 4L [Altica viridicyanea]QCC71324.1 NADH dehydrogenase subunit 4L [Altica cirsicola]QCC71363.1 NADH dehydrogenase subunit 4L [Altica viridicyanea]QCC71376.1 NADH dehydrogenase subunit 4L [Altica cirsicola]QCC71389.1 NADH dehydrogenase subunit 4L [Altica viridicyanea]QCP68685.1 NADH dehydrogenase subunit 4L [Altica viridicyanea]